MELAWFRHPPIRAMRHTRYQPRIVVRVICAFKKVVQRIRRVFKKVVRIVAPVLRSVFATPQARAP